MAKESGFETNKVEINANVEPSIPHCYMGGWS
jgi:hypothetical protein